MKKLPGRQSGTSKAGARPTSPPQASENHPETQGLMRALDKIYDRLRERARAAWLETHPGEDPSDASVSVRIETESGKSLTLSDKIR